MKMTADEFDRELRYQAVMIFVRKMLEQGLINEEEYTPVEELLKDLENNLSIKKWMK